MPALATPLPCRWCELVIRPLGDHGPCVVKDPRTGGYYHLEEAEHFLLTQLDGRRDAETICTAFAERFGVGVQPDDLILENFETVNAIKRLVEARRAAKPRTGA